MQEQNKNTGATSATVLDGMLATARIRELNDAFRQNFTGGRVVMTAGVGALADPVRGAVTSAVRAFDRFDPEDDPFGEHDFGAIEVAGVRIF